MSEESYSEERAFKEAMSLMETGEQEKAKEHFSQLLRTDPDNLEFQAGFFSAGWWLNRQNSHGLHRGGRQLSAWFMHEWDNFSKQASERGYQGCLSFRKAMHYALRSAAENFRLAFQEEGSSSADPELLKELAICLIQLEDYANAADILQYARSKNPHDARLCFLLGEVLCCSEKKEKLGRGLSYYRDAFLMDTQAIEPRWISSTLITGVFTYLHQENQENIEQTLAWFPAYLLAASCPYPLRPLKSTEIQSAHQETERLLHERERVIEKYQQKVEASLCFYILVLLREYASSNKTNRYKLHEYEKKLQEIAPKVLYTFYQEHKNK